MTNYVGQRDQFVDDSGPQNKSQNETRCAQAFKMFFDDQLVEIIVRETNTYAARKIQVRSFIPLQSRMRDWKPVTKDEMYVVLADFHADGNNTETHTTFIFFKKIIFWRLQSLVLIFLLISLNQSAILCIRKK